MVNAIGLIGLILIIIGWTFEAGKIIRTKKSRVDWKFGILYTLGSIALVVYSLQINDYVFLILNAFVTIMSGISLFFSIEKR